MAVYSPTTADYAGLVSQAAPDYFALTQAFFAPELRVTSGKRKIAYDLFSDDDRGLAQLVHWRLNGDPLPDQDFSTTEIEPAYVQNDDPVPVERQFDRIAGEDPMAPMSAAARRDMIVAREMIRRERRVYRLIEKMCADAIAEAEIVLTSPKFPARTLSFGRKANRRATIGVAADLWTAATSDPLQYIADKAQMMHDDSGHEPLDVVHGMATWSAFSRHADVQAMMSAQRGDAFSRRSAEGLDRGLTWKMMDDAGRNHWTAGATYKDAAGAVQKYFPTDGMALIDRAGLMGRVGYGAIIHTATRNEEIPADVFHHLYKSTDGKFENLYSASAPIAFPMDPDASFFAEVI